MFGKEIVCLGLAKVILLSFCVSICVFGGGLLFDSRGMFADGVGLSRLLVLDGFSLKYSILGS